MEKISKETKKMMKGAMEIAQKMNDIYLRPEHLTHSIVETNDPFIDDILTSLGMDTNELLDDLSQKINENLTPRINDSKDYKIDPSDLTKAVMSQAMYEAGDAGDDEVSNIHVLLALLNVNTKTKAIFNSYGVEYMDILNIISPIKETSAEIFTDDNDEDIFQEPDTPTTESKTPVLDSFGVNLCDLARTNVLDPMVGRAIELKRITQILTRKKKNNPILIGEPGVGKSAIAEGLAQSIVDNKAPRKLLGKEVYNLELASIVAGTKYRGQFEERMKAIINEAKANPQVILFIDEIHTMVGAGNSAGSMDAANILKPALARGEIQVIGATTLDEFRENIEKDGALTRRFQQILVKPTTKEETLEILKNVRERYEEHHSCKYSDEALELCVTNGERYISERVMPDSVLDLLDEAGASTHTDVVLPKDILKLEEEKLALINQKKDVVVKEQYEKASKLREAELDLIAKIKTKKEKWNKKQEKIITKIGEEIVAKVTSEITGIPLDKISSDDLKSLSVMAEKIKKYVIGQDNAIDIITKALRRSRLGIQDKNAPMGSFLLAGISGSGKTLLAKKLAELVFGSQDSLVRFDMSEYQESFNVSKLIGSPPGYVGYEEGGRLTEKIRKNPYSLVLFDEIEKAHPDIFRTMLQILDEGHITDSLGRKVNFKNTLIIMTSNVGIKEVAKAGKQIGFSGEQSSEQMKRIVSDTFDKELKDKFPPEFLNRINDIITFNALSKKDISKIVDIEVGVAIAEIKEIEYDVIVTPKLREKIAKDGYSTEYGARPLKRVIMRLVKDTVADAIIDDEVPKGSEITISYNKNTEKVTHKVTTKKRKVAVTT